MYLYYHLQLKSLYCISSYFVRGNTSNEGILKPSNVIGIYHKFENRVSEEKIITISKFIVNNHNYGVHH